MGWRRDTPLGRRGKGIIEPVEATFRHDKDYRGLGFEELQTDEDEVKNISLKITNVGKNYGTAASDYGKVYVPMGALRHIGNVSKMPVRELPRIHISATITKTDDKIKWRLGKVSDVQGRLHQIAPYFLWSEPIIQWKNAKNKRYRKNQIKIQEISLDKDKKKFFMRRLIVHIRIKIWFKNL